MTGSKLFVPTDKSFSQSETWIAHAYGQFFKTSALFIMNFFLLISLPNWFVNYM
jgi:hypothetical protein